MGDVKKYHYMKNNGKEMIVIVENLNYTGDV